VNEGVASVDAVRDQTTQSPKQPKGLLSDLVKEGVLFTHAPLLGYGRLDVDPVQDFFISKRMEHAAPTHLIFDRPVFNNIAGSDDMYYWDAYLFWVRNEHAMHLTQALLGVAISDRVKRTYGGVQLQTVPIADRATPGSTQRPLALTKVPIFVFQYNGSDYRTMIRSVDAFGRLNQELLPPDPALTIEAAIYFSVDEGPDFLLKNELS
jgi:hypothetical protein